MDGFGAEKFGGDDIDANNLTSFLSIMTLCAYCFSIFIDPMGQRRVCKIRFVSTSENYGKLCPACKNLKSAPSSHIFTLATDFP